MIKIGIAGIGFMGVTHYKAMSKIKGGKVVAVFTRDQKKLKGDWRGVKGNFGEDGGVHDLGRIACYSAFEDLISDAGIDLVDICLPTSMHTEFSIRALEAGKHVLVEKPIAISLKDADRMIAAAKKNRRHLMVAHVLRYFPEFRIIKDIMDSGKHGKVIAAHFKRIIARPAWWSSKDLSRTGGPAIDLHIHDADFIQFLFGMPIRVASQGYIGKQKIIEYLNTHYYFKNSPMAVSAEGGWISKQGCPFEHGYDVYFEKATLKFNSSMGSPPLLLTDDGKVRKQKVSTRDGFTGEIQEAVDTIRNKKKSSLCAESARNSLLLCQKEIQSVKNGFKVRVS